MGSALPLVLRTAATLGYLLFGVPLLVLAILVQSSFDALGLLLRGAEAIAGGGAVIASIQAWGHGPKTPSGLGAMVLGVVAMLALIFFALTQGQFGP